MNPWDEPATAAADREAHAAWLAERPAPADADYHEPSDYDWPFDAKEYRRRNGIPEPVDPWNRQCDRCMEFFEEPGCAHGLVLCPSCALTGCQSCACEDADAAAIERQRHEEYWK